MGNWTLTQKFIALSIVGVIGLPLLIGGWATTAMTNYVMAKNATSAAAYMQLFLEPFVQSFERDGKLSEQDLAALEDLSQHPDLRSHVLSIKIWGPDGTILFATAKELIGQTFPPDEIQEPMNGIVHAALDELDAAENAPERELSAPIYEVYAPLRSLSSGKVIAVGEFYEDATDLKQELREAIFRSWLVALALSLALLLPLFFLMRRGSQTIATQEVQLGHLERSLQDSQIRIDAERAHLQDLNEMIRKRIGLALHDGPSQLVTFILLSLDELGEAVQRSKPDKGEDPDSHLAAIRQAAAAALSELRGISKELFSSPSDDSEANTPNLDGLISQSRRDSRTEIQTAGLELIQTLPPRLKRAALRILQEALRNSLKHAPDASRWVEVSLAGHELSLSVSDDGPGFPDDATMNEAARAGHLGMAGMEFQARSVGGSIRRRSGAGQRTSIVFRAPVLEG